MQRNQHTGPLRHLEPRPVSGAPGPGGRPQPDALSRGVTPRRTARRFGSSSEVGTAQSCRGTATKDISRRFLSCGPVPRRCQNNNITCVSFCNVCILLASCNMSCVPTSSFQEHKPGFRQPCCWTHPQPVLRRLVPSKLTDPHRHVKQDLMPRLSSLELLQLQKAQGLRSMRTSHPELQERHPATWAWFDANVDTKAESTKAHLKLLQMSLNSPTCAPA